MSVKKKDKFASLLGGKSDDDNNNVSSQDVVQQLLQSQEPAPEIPAEPETNVVSNEPKNVSTNKGRKASVKKSNARDEEESRKRYSFDLTPTIHKKYKMQALEREENLYELVEDALWYYYDKVLNK